MKRRPVCGALTRLGLPCQRRLLLKGGKCPNHGGCSSGAKTTEGKAIAVAAMHSVRHSPEGRQAHSELLRSLWACPGFRLRVARTKAARAGKRDQAWVMEARLDMRELDRRAQWARRRRETRNAKIRALEAQIANEALNARIARELGFGKPGRGM